MGQELIYTSAPRGLKPGSRGFCTVVGTTGMSANLAQRLESLSGYRHVFGPQDTNARLNPVVFSHLLLTVGGRPYHVLSRVADAGLDYSQRTNKLAHHVVLDVSERVAGGPAWLLRQPGFLETTFDGQPRMLPAGRRPPMGNETPGACRHWAQVAGDAGWGGVLAEATVSGRKAYLVFRPGMEMLPLLAESLALLPPEKRWDVTFSTYLTGLPPGVDCQLACVVQGSPEHARLRQTPNAVVIDLCGALGPASEGEYERAARSGDISRLAGLTSPAIDQYPLPQTASGVAMIEDAAVAARSCGAIGGSPPPLAAPTTSTGSQLDSAFQRRTFRRKEAPKWPSYALLAGIVLLVVGSGTALWLASRRGTEVAGKGNRPPAAARRFSAPVARPDNPPAKPIDASEKPATGPDVKPEKQPVASAQEQSSAPPVVQPTEPAGPPAPKEPEKPLAENHTQASATPAEATPAEAPPMGSPPSATSTEHPNQENVADRPDETAVPRPMLSLSAGIVEEDAKADQDGWYTLADLGPLHANDRLQLTLAGPERLFVTETVLEPVAIPSPSGEGNVNSREWRLTAKGIELGIFALHGQHLQFKWGEKPSGMFEPRSLRNCLLVATKDGGDHPIARITLREPIRAKRVPIGDFLDGKSVPLPVAITDMPNDIREQLRWEFLPGTMGGENGLPQVTMPEPAQTASVSKPGQPQSGSVFSVTIPGEEPIEVSMKNAKVIDFRNGLALSFSPQMESPSSINPPWKPSVNTPFERKQIGSLRTQAQRQLEKAEKDFRKIYSNVNLDAAEVALKYNSGLLHGKQEQQQRLQNQPVGEKLTQETAKTLSKLTSDIANLERLVQELDFIVKIRSYRDRLDRLVRGFDALGRMNVGYRVYMLLDEEADESVLLVDGVEDPSDTKPAGNDGDLLAPVPAKTAQKTPSPDSGNGGGKPSIPESGTKDESIKSPELP